MPYRTQSICGVIITNSRTPLVAPWCRVRRASNTHTPTTREVGYSVIQIYFAFSSTLCNSACSCLVQNITYMCAKVNATSGCYRQKYISGLEVEVCVCDSQLGHMPCNRAACSFRNLLKNVILLLLLGGLSHIWLWLGGSTVNNSNLLALKLAQISKVK